MDFSSKLLKNAVDEISLLPGIGKRTALRLALHLLKQPKENTLMLSSALNALRRILSFVKIAIIFQTNQFVRYARIQREIKMFFA